MEPVSRFLQIIIQTLEQTSGQVLLGLIIAAFFLGKHGTQVESWINDTFKIVISAAISVVLEEVIREAEFAPGPLSAIPEAPGPASVLVFVILFVVILFVVNWLL